MQGRTGLVTGGAGGIGRACALRFAMEGAAVVVADLPGAVEGAEETVEQITAAGGQAEFFPCDVSSSAASQGLVAHVARRYGRLDFAHNSAGTGVQHRLHETSDEDFDRVIALDLRGTFLGCKHQIAEMLGNQPPHRGAIVNTAFTAGPSGAAELSAYAAGKHGLIGLTKAAAVEYADAGIRINAVYPRAVTSPPASEGSFERPGEIIAPPATWRGDLAAVAAAVVWLCSGEAFSATGIVMPVDVASPAGTPAPGTGRG